MIRERLEQDLDLLCAILETMDSPAESLAGKDPREWLLENDTELAWVFDMAPVSVAPTKNVVGHLEIYKPADNTLAIGKHFVRPDTYENNIGRFLLRESVKYIQAHGQVPTLDLRQTSFPRTFYQKAGFTEAPSNDPDNTLMHYLK
ncbi:GNAT family N-acetyltransferase [Kribbella sp. NPDC023855]|uniref:GNAT family N-acetyltransferase n=1 Tax=Kribbella sp. NPDC023855 TaxID=3154698 RepID=UPI0033E37D60